MKNFRIGLCKKWVENIESGSNNNAITKAVKVIEQHLCMGDSKTAVTVQAISNNHCVLSYEKRWNVTKQFLSIGEAWEYAHSMIKKLEVDGKTRQITYIEEGGV